MGPDVDGIKLAGGSALAMQRQAVVDLVDAAHEHGVYAACAGSLEAVLQKVLDAHTILQQLLGRLGWSWSAQHKRCHSSNRLAAFIPCRTPKLPDVCMRICLRVMHSMTISRIRHN